MMAHKCTVLGMLVSLHSLGLIFASLFTYKWYVDNSRDIGIFGICEYLNATSINKFVNVNANLSAASGVGAAASSTGTARMNAAIFEALKVDRPFEADPPLPTGAELNQTTTIASPQAHAEALVSPKATTTSTSKTYTLLTYSKIYQKCYQLLWPESDDAFEYLATKPVFLTAMMGVAISSASLGFLTFAWACICVMFRSVGSHPRAGELLLILSVLTDIATVTTFGLFMGREDRLHSFKHYGISFWFSVSAACGFFFTSILFAVNRINIGFKYMLRNYQSQFSET